MTDTMSARQRIGTIINDARHVLFIDEATDRIIEVVLETLLGEDGVRWAASAVANRLADMIESGEAHESIGEEITAEVLMAMAEAALTQATDSMFPKQENTNED